MSQQFTVRASLCRELFVIIKERTSISVFMWISVPARCAARPYINCHVAVRSGHRISVVVYVIKLLAEKYIPCYKLKSALEQG